MRHLVLNQRDTSNMFWIPRRCKLCTVLYTLFCQHIHIVYTFPFPPLPYPSHFSNPFFISFLPRCMQCRRGLAMRILSFRLSVRPSVCHTRVLWQNGRKLCPDFYTIWKNIYPSFLRRKMVGGGRPLLPEILGQPTPVGTKSPIFKQ